MDYILYTSHQSSVYCNIILLTQGGSNLQYSVLTHIEIHQKYTSGGKYRYFIKINGEEVFSIINTNAQQFYDIKIYASNPWELPWIYQGYDKALSLAKSIEVFFYFLNINADLLSRI